jgi:hypothetical protein
MEPGTSYTTRSVRRGCRLVPIEYSRHAEAVLQDNAVDKQIRLVLSREPELGKNVSITPIKHLVNHDSQTTWMTSGMKQLKHTRNG